MPPFLVADMGQERLIGVLGLGPVHTVHIGGIEAMFHDAPAFLKDLAALSVVIDFDASGEREPASPAAASRNIGWGRGAAPRRLSGGFGGRRVTSASRAAAGDRQGIDSLILAVVKGAAVLREFRGTQAGSTASPAGRRRSVFLARPTGLREPPRLLAAFQSLRPNTLYGPAALDAARHEDERLTIGSDDDSADGVASPGQLPGAPGDAVKINFDLDLAGAGSVGRWSPVASFRARASARPRSFCLGGFLLAVEFGFAGLFILLSQGDQVNLCRRSTGLPDVGHISTGQINDGFAVGRPLGETVAIGVGIGEAFFRPALGRDEVDVRQKIATGLGKRDPFAVRRPQWAADG